MVPESWREAEGKDLKPKEKKKSLNVKFQVDRLIPRFFNMFSLNLTIKWGLEN